MKSIKLPSWIERALGIEPQPLPPQIFAVDQAGLRLAVFRRDLGGTSLAFSGEHPWPATVFQNGPLGGPVAEPEILQTAITELVAESAESFSEAVLVLPDLWMRTAFASLNELPGHGRAREEVLRWKLKQLVPFRVEELRLRAEEVPALANEKAPRRVLLGFAVEQLVADLEAAFGACGLRLGWITNETLATLAASDLEANTGASLSEGLLATLLVRPGSYSLAVQLAGKPVILRLKSVDASLAAHSLRSTARRELLLTSGLLEAQFPGRRVEEVAVLAHSEAEEWAALASEALGSQSRVLRCEEMLGLEPAALPLDWFKLAPMLGATAQRSA